MRLLFSIPVILLFSIGWQGALHAQDTIAQQRIDEEEVYVHSPHKATIYSTVLPGLGQFYNKKYWKIPIVYAGIGVIGYFILENRAEYLHAQEAYNYVFNEEDYPIDNDLIGRYDENALRTIRDYYRRNMEVSYIFMALWYALNIIDATVDAHFFHYDVSDNLSVQLEPTLISPFGAETKQFGMMRSPGIRFKINF